jgi:oxygen-independent coproporphyrinogen-3 oxidase
MGISILPANARQTPQDLRLDTALLPSVEIRGLYVHIPFCFHKCHYCDFYSITRQTPERKRHFVDLILREAGQWRDRQVRPRTVFFGGGTPTLLAIDEMRRLIEGLKKTFDFSACDEWTIEVNPATVTDEYCRVMRDAGVNRLSFGAQSFNRAELKLLERHHDPDDVAKSLEMARSAGFERLNIDLIYAICGQDMRSWAKSLETALSLRTEHLSCYGLTYESNTPLTVRKRLGQVRAVEESVELQMMYYTRERLAGAGMEAYEISNYARPDGECRHNLMYWNGGDYIGLGPSAASHVQGWRWKNQPHLGQWESSIESGDLPATDVEFLSPARRAGELAMLMLRLRGGIEYNTFLARTGLVARSVFADAIDRFSSMGLLDSDDIGVRLTSRGLAVADSLAAEFLAVER